MGEPVKSAESPLAVPQGHERSDVHVRPLAWFLAGLTGLLVVTVVAVVWLFDALLEGAERGDPTAPLVESERVVRDPPLQVSPRGDVESLRKRENAELASVAWVDESQGIVRMPIERAMELAAERPFPAWPTVDVEAANEGQEAAP